MDDWRDRILKEFTPKIAPLTLVADPDGLLFEETLLEAIRERDSRYSRSTTAWRSASPTNPGSDPAGYGARPPISWLWSTPRGTSSRPFLTTCCEPDERSPSVWASCSRGLSYPVVASLDRGHLGALHRGRIRHGTDRLGDDATKDFVLLHVFDIAPAIIRQPADLLRVLLRKHHQRQRLPPILDERLIHLLRRNGGFGAWPLETIVPDPDAFFSFLQERWPRFLDRLAGIVDDSRRDARESVGLEIDGPADLPFDHDDVRVYIDNLFFEGVLSPVSHEAVNALRGEWVTVGMRIESEADKSRRLGGLMDAVGAAIPAPDGRHHEWTAFAHRWAELCVLRLEAPAPARLETGPRVAELQMEVDRSFLAWIERRYAGLHNQPPDPPVMVHHVPRYLARRLEHGFEDKVALIVVDGLAIDQWIVLREVLADQRPCLRFREGAVFAWVPTITSVSRQAIFAGKPPLYFPRNILRTDGEPSSWNQFWEDQGVQARAVDYAKGLGDGPLDAVDEILSRTAMRALGLVVDQVDKIMHGMVLGTAGMHNLVRQWASEGFMAELLDLLLGNGFAVFLTSDHGNIEAEGHGSPSEGVVADVRGERVRIYPDEGLRSRVQQQFPNAIAWPTIGLPEDCLALLAPARAAFVREGERIVGHGGASLEEVVVPWIRIERAVP